MEFSANWCYLLPYVQIGAVWWNLVQFGATWGVGEPWWSLVQLGALWCRLVLFGVDWCNLVQLGTV